MPRVLTGLQSSGRQHLGNVLGAILPAIEQSNDPKNEAFLFIADFHSLTTIKDAETRIYNTRATAAAWLACGFDADKHTFYRQSRIPEVTELAWYLNCYAPYPMLANAHSFKDKADRLSDVNAGLFTYPVLMAADILLYDADLVPVGKDQLQHLEIARDLAESFNHQMGETFVVPGPLVSKNTMVVSGTDGKKMSKSYGNVIDIFLPQKQLKKQVMAIVTDSISLEEPKDPDTCTVFELYSLLADQEQIASMRTKYRGGNYGYGHAKKELLDLLLERFAGQRLRFDQLMESPEDLDAMMTNGEVKARKIASQVLERVKQKLGFA